MSDENDDGHRFAGETATPPTSSTYWVVDGLFLAGAYPGDPEPKKHEQKIQALLAAGVRLFVNLMEADETDHRGRRFVPYDNTVRELCPDAECVRFPIQDLSVPSAEEMQTILDTIDESLGEERPVYVHCWGGVGRTGTVVGCWLLRHGLAEPANVLDTLLELRKQDQERGQRMSPETAAQQRFVKQWPTQEAKE
jgi:protein-tyrosine phosphatase